MIDKSRLSAGLVPLRSDKPLGNGECMDFGTGYYAEDGHGTTLATMARARQKTLARARAMARAAIVVLRQGQGWAHMGQAQEPCEGKSVHMTRVKLGAEREMAGLRSLLSHL